MLAGTLYWLGKSQKPCDSGPGQHGEGQGDVVQAQGRLPLLVLLAAVLVVHLGQVPVAGEESSSSHFPCFAFGAVLPAGAILIVILAILHM